jgi:Zn-dependent metalloprotease
MELPDHSPRRAYDPIATVERGTELARRTYARLEPSGEDGLGAAKTNVHEGEYSFFNRISRVASIGVGGRDATSEHGRLSTLESTIHELSHRWFDTRAMGVGLIYAGGPGRLSEGLAQVMAGTALILEGTPEEAKWGWHVLDPSTQTTGMRNAAGKLELVPLSCTMDDVRRRGFSLADNGLVHVHSGVIQAAHLEIAQRIGPEAMGELTVAAGHRLTPVTGFERWASLMIDAAQSRFGPNSAQQAAVSDAWRHVGVLD